MTPDRWRQIIALFEAAQRIEPGQRAEWLRCACGTDDDLRTEVGRLIAQDGRAGRDESLEPPTHAELRPVARDPDATRPGPPGGSGPVDEVVPAGLAESRPGELTESVPAGLAESAPAALTVAGSGATPKTALVPGVGPRLALDARSLELPRLRNLAMVYL